MAVRGLREEGIPHGACPRGGIEERTTLPPCNEPVAVSIALMELWDGHRLFAMPGAPARWKRLSLGP